MVFLRHRGDSLGLLGTPCDFWGLHRTPVDSLILLVTFGYSWGLLETHWYLETYLGLVASLGDSWGYLGAPVDSWEFFGLLKNPWDSLEIVITPSDSW